MGASEVDAVLARLVSQFASPYDFLRELVQNSMDAGADRVDVTLERHDDGPELAHGAAVFELTFMDTGSGMDETIIDGALTRLFSSSKADDRTMAGGFGVGFVSIFAWEPELVLLQTGRGGEAWELIFHLDRRFEKHRLDLPVEGTTLTMLRSGDAGVYASVVEAVRDSLWRWCRYCPLEITFEDLSGDLGPELVQDAPMREEQVLAHREQVGDGEVRVAFGVPSHATLLRRGLILAEGAPAAHVSSLEIEGRSVDHLQLWIDSPDLETTLARDKVVKSEGREKLEVKVHEAIESLRGELVAELGRLATDPGPFTVQRAGRYGTLHAHLQLEWVQVAEAARSQALLRLHQGSGEHAAVPAISPRALVAATQGGPVPWVALEPDNEGDDEGANEGASEAAHGKVLAHSLGDYPVLAVRAPSDALWLEQLMGHLGLQAVPFADLVGQIEAAPEGARLREICTRVQAVLSDLASAGARVQVRAAASTDASDDPPLCAWRLGNAALTSRAGLGPAALSDLWLDGRHLIVRGAIKAYDKAPRAALASLLSAVLSVVEAHIDPKLLAQRIEQEAGAW